VTQLRAPGDVAVGAIGDRLALADRLHREVGVGPVTVSEEAIAWLMQQPYSGTSVDSTRSYLPRQHFGDRGDLADAIAAYNRTALPGPGLARAIPTIEQIERTIAEFGGNVSQAAHRLGINYSACATRPPDGSEAALTHYSSSTCTPARLANSRVFESAVASRARA
jgi:hypothetical protein